MYLNKAMVYGNLTRDPELKALPSGTNVCTMSLATNRKFKDKDGNYQDAVDYHNITIFGKQAESTAQYLKKGSTAYVEGRLQTRSWEKDGVKQYRTEIIAERVQFGPRKDADAAPAPKPAASTTPAAGEAPDYPEEEIDPSDIPF